jgi:hypothetical protein
MNLMKKSLVTLLAFSALAFGQLTQTSTTLAQAVTGPGVGSTGAARYPTTIYLASLTGITAPAQPTSTTEIGTPTGNSFTILYVDREAMQVLAINTNLTAVSVNRGYLGTTPTAHLNGSTVYYGPPNYFGNLGYYSADGPSGACTATLQTVLPVIETDTGNQYNCVPITSGSTTGIWERVSTDGYFFIDPVRCSSAVATTAYASGYPINTSAATGESVYQVTTNSTAGTIEVTCPLTVPERLATGKGVTLNSASLLYGVQTTALSSIAAATVKSVTFPVSTAAGAAAAGTVAAAGGTITKTPTTLQLATTTSGLCYNEKLTFGTPIQATTDVTSYALDQVFTTAGTTATTLQVCGAIVYYSINQ